MAGKVRFVGSVQHTEDTLQRLFKTEYRTYHRLGILAQLAVGFAMAALALTVEMSRPLQGVLLLVGCLVMVSGDLPASLRADKAVDSRKGSLPKNVCSFFEDRMELSGEGSMRLEYGRFQRLIDDDGYLYLFLGRGSVCMIDKAAIEGGTPEELKDFTARRTGLAWRRGRSFLSMNLADLRQAVRDHRAR